MTSPTPRGLMKPTSVTMHPEAHRELLELCAVVGGSHQDIMRAAIQRASQRGMALHVPEWTLQRRGSSKVRKPKMLYMRPAECHALSRLERELDLNASRTIEVCLHSAWLAQQSK